MALKSKLIVLCSVLMSFTIIVGAISYWGILKIDGGLNQISQVSLPKIQLADNLYIHFAKTRIALRTLGLANLDDKSAQEAITNMKNEIESYEKVSEKLKAMPFMEGEEAIIKRVEKNWGDLKAIGFKVLDLYKTNSKEDKEKIQSIFLNDCPIAADNYNKSIVELVGYHEKVSKKWNDQALKDPIIVRNLQIAIILFGAFLSIAIGYFFSKNISTMIVSISNNISSGSNQIEQYTKEISIVSNSLLKNISKQAISLQETSSAVEQTNGSINDNAQNVQKSFQISELSQKSAKEGKRSMDDALMAMDKISNSISEIKNEIDLNNKEVGAIVGIINEIAAKTKIINDIVFQTKLLSFNASVEAARAGQHGKGFSVVAEEIGNLATMSGNSAHEIGHLLEVSIQKVEETINNSKNRITNIVTRSNEVVGEGNLTIEKCNMNLDEIIGHINNLNSLIGDISRATNEQAQSMSEINEAMNMIDSASIENSSSSQQASETVSMLEEQLDDFREIVINLNTIVQGKRAA